MTPDEIKKKLAVQRDRFGDARLNLNPPMGLITNNFGEDTFLNSRGVITTDLGWTFNNGQQTQPKKKV
jgi:hypothetical protein